MHYISHVENLQNVELETYFRNMEFLYSCLKSRIPEAVNEIRKENVGLALYGTSNAVSQINVKYKNASNYIYGSNSLNADLSEPGFY